MVIVAFSAQGFFTGLQAELIKSGNEKDLKHNIGTREMVEWLRALKFISQHQHGDS